jgi:tetratricopeptide (TPR) repeat protein
MQALDRYDYEEAAVHLEKYLSIHPTDPDALLLAAQTARRRGNLDEASRRLRLAEQHGASAEAVGTERELQRIQGGDLTDAPQLANFCAEHAGDRSGALALEVLIEGSLKRLNVAQAKWAVDLWLTRRQEQADQAQGLVWRGRVNEFSQDFPQALVDYRQAVELAPDHAQARLRLVELLIREEPREAAPHLEWLRRRLPNDPEVRFQTARLRRNLGQPEEAGRLLDELLASTPNKVSALVERGRVAMDLNHTDEAERWLLRAQELEPQSREVNLALGDCMRQADRLEEAKGYQEKVQEIDARLKQALDEMARKGGQ